MSETRLILPQGDPEGLIYANDARLASLAPLPTCAYPPPEVEHC